MSRLGGLWPAVPRMGGVSLVFTMASLGLPGLGNFVAEILTLQGSFKSGVTGAIAATAVATTGLVMATVYALIFFDRTFLGEKREEWKPSDLTARDLAVLGTLIAAIVWLGLYPQPVIDTARGALDQVLKVIVARG